MSFPRSTAPAPATPWRATLHSRRPCGTRRAPPGRTACSSSSRTSPPRRLTFWKRRARGTPQPAAPTCRAPTRYSTLWLLERGRYTERTAAPVFISSLSPPVTPHLSFYGTRVQISEEYAMYLMTVIEETCKMCKCVHVIYCIFWKTIKRLNGKRKCGTSGLHLELFRRKITTKTRSHQLSP